MGVQGTASEQGGGGQHATVQLGKKEKEGKRNQKERDRGIGDQTTKREGVCKGEVWSKGGTMNSIRKREGDSKT